MIAPLVRAGDRVRCPRALLLGSTLLLALGCAGHRPPQTAASPLSTGAAPAGALATLHADARLAGTTLAGTARRDLLPRSPAQLEYLGALAAASAALASDKEPLRQDVQRSDVFADSGWTEVGGRLGLSRNVEITAAGLYVAGLAGHLPRTRETGLLLGESLFAAQGAAGLLRFTFSEERPESGGRLRYFHAGSSSVSIHATNTTAVARVLDHQLLGGLTGHPVAKTFARIGLYSIPAVTDWQRLRSDQHFLWNVVLGSGTSFYVTSALLREHDHDLEPETSAGEPRAHLTVAAAPVGGKGGEVVVAASF